MTPGPVEPTERDPIVRALRRLTIAVWALTGIMAVLVAMYLALYVASYIPWLTESSSPSGRSVSVREPPAKVIAQFEDFYAQPPEKQIAAASVIAIVRYQKDGERSKCLISEILKQTPGVKFYYKVGDELVHCSHYPKAGENRGDGQVVFFVGDPAQFRFSSSFHGERLGGLGDMPLDLLRKQIGDPGK